MVTPTSRHETIAYFSHARHASVSLFLSQSFLLWGVVATFHTKTIRRLDAIEEQRRRAKERELDREKRRVEFTTKIGRSTLVLQRYERGRQARRKARVRARAVVTIAAWMTAKIRQAAMIKAIKNRAILKMMVQVGFLGSSAAVDAVCARRS